MSDMNILARLGVDVKNWSQPLKEAQADASKFKGEVSQVAAGVALLEKQFRAAGGATGEQRKLLKEYRSELSGLESDLRRAESQVKKFQAAQSGGGGHGDHGGGNARMAGMEAGHSVRSIFDMIGAGQSFGQASQMELPRLLQASGSGLGALIGIEAVAGTVKAIEATLEKAREARKEFRESLSGGGIGTSSTSSLERQMAGLAEARDKYMPDEEKPATLGDWAGRKATNLWRGLTGGQSVEDEQGGKIEALEQRRINISAEIARRKGEEVALDERAAHEGEQAVASDRERLALLNRIREVQDDKNLDGTAQARIVDLLKGESALRQRHIAQVKEQHDAEVAAAHDLAESRAGGTDTPTVRAGQALTEAQRKRDATPEGTPERAAANDEVSNRQVDVRDANRADAERTAAAAENARILGMNAPETKKQRERLNSESTRLNRLFLNPDPANPPTADELRKATERLPQINAELHGLDRGDTQRGFQREREQVTAATGRGPGAQINAINARLGINQREQADNSGNENDPDRAQKLQTEASELLKTRKEIAFTYSQELASAQAETRALAEQVSGHTAAGKAAEIHAKFAEKIAKALNDGKRDLAEQYRLQEKIATVPADAAKFRESQNHAAQAAEQRQQQRDKMDAQKQQDKGATHDATRSGGSAVDSQGPDTAIPYAGQPGGTSAVSSFDNVDLPDNPNIPDNANIPDNKGMNFDQIGTQMTMPAPDAPDGNRTSGTPLTHEGMKSLLGDHADSISQTVTDATTG